MNRPLPPGDCGRRGADSLGPSRSARTVSGAFGLVGGVAHPPKRRTPPSTNPAARLKGIGRASGFHGIGALAVVALGRRNGQAHLLSDYARQEAQPSSESVSEEAIRRKGLLAEYKNATGNPSNQKIYKARNSAIHKPEFYEWLRGELPATSQTAINFERFLAEKKPPIPRNPSD